MPESQTGVPHFFRNAEGRSEKGDPGAPLAGQVHILIGGPLDEPSPSRQMCVTRWWG